MSLVIRILAIVIFIAALGSLFYYKSEKFNLASKLILGILCIVLLASIVFYELSLEKQSEANREVLNAFNQGKTLICKDYEVTKEQFNFVGGTKVFSAKEEFKGLSGVILSVEECRIK